jgi:hypothetical protein
VSSHIISHDRIYRSSWSRISMRRLFSPRTRSFYVKITGLLALECRQPARLHAVPLALPALSSVLSNFKPRCCTVFPQQLICSWSKGVKIWINYAFPSVTPNHFERLFASHSWCDCRIFGSQKLTATCKSILFIDAWAVQTALNASVRLILVCKPLSHENLSFRCEITLGKHMFFVKCGIFSFFIILFNRRAYSLSAYRHFELWVHLWFHICPVSQFLQRHALLIAAQMSNCPMCSKHLRAF